MLGRKPALKRAFKYTVQHDTEDDNATIEQPELPALLRNIVLFHKVCAFVCVCVCVCVRARVCV